jgi:hypothetical protein
MQASPEWVTNLGIPVVATLMLLYSVLLIWERFERRAKERGSKDDKGDEESAQSAIKASEIKVLHRLDAVESNVLSRVDGIENTLLSQMTNLESLVSGIKVRSVNIARQTEDLWKWHNQKDEDGVPVWYVRRSLERSIRELSESVRAQTVACNEIIGVSNDIRSELRRSPVDSGNISRIGTGKQTPIS